MPNYSCQGLQVLVQPLARDLPRPCHHVPSRATIQMLKSILAGQRLTALDTLLQVPAPDQVTSPTNIPYRSRRRLHSRSTLTHGPGLVRIHPPPAPRRQDPDAPCPRPHCSAVDLSHPACSSLLLLFRQGGLCLHLPSPCSTGTQHVALAHS